jgi:hypothetical protein
MLVYLFLIRAMGTTFRRLGESKQVSPVRVKYLSNITASMIIFFGFPYRVGDRIKVTDADFDISGTVEEISLFHVLIRTDAGNIITYPNSLILQKPVIKLEGDNTSFPGKLFAPAPRSERSSLRQQIRSKISR